MKSEEVMFVLVFVYLLSFSKITQKPADWFRWNIHQSGVLAQALADKILVVKGERHAKSKKHLLWPLRQFKIAIAGATFELTAPAAVLSATTRSLQCNVLGFQHQRTSLRTHFQRVSPEQIDIDRSNWCHVELATDD